MIFVLLRDGLNSFNGTTDHLLPQKKYRELGFDKANGNSVACCTRCNSLKGAYDPNENKPVYDDARHRGVIGPTERAELIRRSREYVQEKLKLRHAAWKHWVGACKELEERE